MHKRDIPSIHDVNINELSCSFNKSLPVYTVGMCHSKFFVNWILFDTNEESHDTWAEAIDVIHGF